MATRRDADCSISVVAAVVGLSEGGDVFKDGCANATTFVVFVSRIMGRRMSRR
jgi:hypothetical protein